MWKELKMSNKEICIKYLSITKINNAKLLVQDKNLYNIFIKNYNILKKYYNIISQERQLIHLKYSIFNKTKKQFELKDISNLSALINELDSFVNQVKDIKIYYYPLCYIQNKVPQNIIDQLDFMIKKD